MTKRKSKSAADFLADLNTDPEYVARRGAQEDARVLHDAAIRVDTQPLREQLIAAGYPVASLDDLVGKYAPLPAPVVELLLEWLTKVSDAAVQEQVIRALGASAVPFDGDPLVQLFLRTESAAVRYAIANTIAQATVRGVGPWSLKAVQDTNHGTARQMLALAAARHNPAAVVNPVRVGLLDQIPGHAALALAESGGEHELGALERAYAVAGGWVKQEIGRAVSVIRRRLSERS